MKSTKIAVIITLLLIAVSFSACTNNNGPQGQNTEGTYKVEKTTDQYGNWVLADWTDIEVFQMVPAMTGEGIAIGTAVDSGGGTYTMDINGVSLEDYQKYLGILESAGFQKYVDNGNEGLYGDVYSSTYTRDTLVLTVTHLVKLDKTYVSGGFDLPLSERLIYQDAYASGNQEGAKTKLHMVELVDEMGNSFVIQLKNGHFIVMDGGQEVEAPYLLNYLESQVPEGEKPVIEAWLISHAHSDHAGVISEVAGNEKYADRIFVEGIYFCEPSENIVNTFDKGVISYIQYVDLAGKILKKPDGTPAEVYRPQMGQRYYFSDITMDVVMSQEFMIEENYSGDYNDSSTWVMLTIDGQKCLFGADGEWGEMMNVMRTYDKEDFAIDVFQVLHHGHNTMKEFTDFCTAKTALFPAPEFRESTWQPGAQADLLESVEECLYFGEGTKVLTFPYQVGTSVTMPKFELGN